MAKRKSATVKWIRAVLLGLLALAVLTVAAYYVSRALEKRTYRLSYPNEVIASAEEFGLDRYLVAAVIHCESGNDAMAVSPRGARGLMQIMPDTGLWIAEKLELTGFSEDMLFDPAVNVRFGCWYLRYLTDKFSGDRRLILAAYNAGPGNVAKWLENDKYSTNGSLIEIPFPETANYVEKVHRAYEKYSKLYEKELG